MAPSSPTRRAEPTLTTSRFASPSMVSVLVPIHVVEEIVLVGNGRPIAGLAASRSRRRRQGRVAMLLARLLDDVQQGEQQILQADSGDARQGIHVRAAGFLQGRQFLLDFLRR